MNFKLLMAFAFDFCVLPILNPGIMKVGAEEGNKILVILLDGFRWDYLETFFRPNELPGFSKMIHNGVRAKGLKPDFPSLSYPNYYSLMTGLHVENHGMIHNYMYDPATKLRFLIGENPDQFNSIWWDDGEPLWVTANRQGKNSYWWYWCGCEVEIRKTRPTFCQPYSSAPNPSFQNFSDALDSAVEVIKNGSADLVGVYFEEVDHWGHLTGPKGENVSSIIRQVDAQLERILSLLESEVFPSDGKKLSERVNVVIFSDHGMTALIDGRDGIVRFDTSLVKPGDVVIGPKFGPVLQIYTSEDNVDVLYERVKDMHPNVSAYKKQDIPQRYFYKSHRRTPPLILVADPGYAIVYKPNVTNNYLGFHGYDNEHMDMHGIFLAYGPSFKKGMQTDTLRVIDLYQVMCHVLDIRPSPHNGTWDRVSNIFTRSSAIRLTVSYSASALVLILTILFRMSERNI